MRIPYSHGATSPYCGNTTDRKRHRRSLHHKYLLTLLLSCLLSACATSPTALITNSLADRLTFSILNNNDPQTIAEALPTFLVLMDSMAYDGGGTDLLLAAAKLYSAYAGSFLDSGDRQQRLSSKGMSYAKKGACQYDEKLCGLTGKDFDTVSSQAALITIEDVPVIYTLATSWLGYVQAHSDDWAVVADLPKVKVLLEAVIREHEDFDYGGAHLYLGGIATLLPPSMGGKPEVGRYHFEKAIDISKGLNLIAKVEFARRYARLLFDQELHHRLLTEVLETNADVEGLILINALAQQQAKQLLAEEAEYF